MNNFCIIIPRYHENFQIKDQFIGLNGISFTGSFFVKTKEGLEIFNTLYNDGADPGIIIQDLLEVVHWLSRVVLTPEVSDEPGVSQIDKEKGVELAKKLSMSELSQTWQILLKGYQELQNHEMPHIVAEMILIRLAFASKLQSLDEIKKSI